MYSLHLYNPKSGKPPTYSVQESNSGQIFYESEIGDWVRRIIPDGLKSHVGPELKEHKIDFNEPLLAIVHNENSVCRIFTILPPKKNTVIEGINLEA